MSTSIYTSYLEQDNTASSDVERKSLFWILSHGKGLSAKIHHLYDFDDHSIIPESLNSASLTDSEKALIRLGYNLFNGYKDEFTSPLDLLCSLDGDNFEVAMKAIRIRFNELSHK